MKNLNDIATNSMPSATLPGHKDAQVIVVEVVVILSLVLFAIAMVPVVCYMWRMRALPGVFTSAAEPPHCAPVAELGTDVSPAVGGVVGHNASGMGSVVDTVPGSIEDPTQYIEAISFIRRFSKAKRRQEHDALFPPRKARRVGTGGTIEREASGGSRSPERRRSSRVPSSMQPRSGPRTPKMLVASRASISTAPVLTPPAESTDATERPRTRQRQMASRFPSRSNPPSTSRTPARTVALTTATKGTTVSTPSAEAEGVSEPQRTRQRRKMSQITSQSNTPSTSRNPAATLAPPPTTTRKTHVSTPRARATGSLEIFSGKKRLVFNETSIQHHALVAGNNKRMPIDSAVPQLERHAATSPAFKATSSVHFLPLVAEPSKKRVKGVSSPTERAIGATNKGSTVHCCDPAFKNDREVWVRAPYLRPAGDKVAGVSVFLPATLVRLRLPQAPTEKEPTVFVKPGGLKKELSWMSNNDRTMWEVPKSCIFNKVSAGPSEKCDTCCQTNKQLFVTPDNLEVLCDRCADHPRETTCVHAWKRGTKPPTFGFNAAAGCDCSVACSQHHS